MPAGCSQCSLKVRSTRGRVHNCPPDLCIPHARECAANSPSRNPTRTIIRSIPVYFTSADSKPFGTQNQPNRTQRKRHQLRINCMRSRRSKPGNYCNGDMADLLPKSIQNQRVYMCSGEPRLTRHLMRQKAYARSNLYDNLVLLLRNTNLHCYRALRCRRTIPNKQAITRPNLCVSVC